MPLSNIASVVEETGNDGGDSVAACAAETHIKRSGSAGFNENMYMAQPVVALL